MPLFVPGKPSPAGAQPKGCPLTSNLHISQAPTTTTDHVSEAQLPNATMTSQHPLAQDKVPRESVDVESLAQELSRYLKITTEDTEFLSLHATSRDELITELYKQPDVKSGPLSANQFVQGGDPEAHLVPANAEIERLTPPKTLEE